MSLSKQISDTFPVGITIPKEVGKMLDYIESHKSRYFQTDIQFYPMAQSEITDYFNNDAVGQYFGLLGTTGDGSILAIWKDEDTQRFVHFGSEGGNWLILASNPIDFIKLIAVGYGYFGEEEIINPPENSSIDKEFRNWVEKTFSVKIPKSGQKIVDLKSERLLDWIDSE